MRATRGTLAALGLLPEQWRTSDSIARLLVEERCTGDCARCAAECAVRGDGQERGTWQRVSVIRLSDALRAQRGVFDHCEISAPPGPGALRELVAAVAAVAACEVPVWAVYPVQSAAELERLRRAGAVRVVFPVGPPPAGRQGARGSISIAEAVQLVRDLHRTYPGRVAVRVVETGGTAEVALAELRRAGVPILTDASGDEGTLV